MRSMMVASLMGWAGPVWACDVALMLAVDVSGSVDAREYRVQMDGLAAALIDPPIADALVAGRAKVAVMQWTGSGRQAVVINWTEMTDHAQVGAFADQIIAEPRLWRDYSTAIGEAMALSLTYFAQVPECLRYIIDISGDGESNEGRAPAATWADLEKADVTVNALVIEESVPGLTRYFEQEVITGPGSFAITANRFDDYRAQTLPRIDTSCRRSGAQIDQGDRLIGRKRSDHTIRDHKIFERDHIYQNPEDRDHFSRLKRIGPRDSLHGMVHKPLKQLSCQDSESQRREQIWLM